MLRSTIFGSLSTVLAVLVLRRRRRLRWKRSSGGTSARSSMHQKLVQMAPLLVVPFVKLRALGHLPRRTQCGATCDGQRCGADHSGLTVEVDGEWDRAAKPIVFISHIWVEPSGDEGRGRVDNEANRKHHIVCKGIEALCARHKLNVDGVYVFLEWVSVPQDGSWEHKVRFLQSLPAFVAQVSFMLIPLDCRLFCEDQYRVDADGNPLAMSWSVYSGRGWTRLEMLTARRLAAAGANLRVYRYDLSWPEAGRLTEVPPFTTGSHLLEPTAPESTFTCCQCDHWDASAARAMPCDRVALRPLEERLAEIVERYSGERRAILRRLLPACLPDRGVPLVPLAAFLARDHSESLSLRAWRSGASMATEYTDRDLEDKIVIFISHSWWFTAEFSSLPYDRREMSMDPSNPLGVLKYRWICAALRRLVELECLDMKQVLVFIDMSCILQDDDIESKDRIRPLLPLLARITYLLVCDHIIGQNSFQDGFKQDYFSRGWNRLELFIARLLQGHNLYTAVYVTSLLDTNSLAGMAMQILEDERAAPITSVRTYSPEDDALCPWRGCCTHKSDLQLIHKISEALLTAMSRLPQGKADDREQLICRECAEFC